MSCKADLEISVLSVEYVKVPVRATVDGVAYDPTADAVQLAIVSHDAQPTLADWHAGSWETTASEYLARLLVGPGQAVAPAIGYHDVWVKITDNPETPVIKAGILLVT